MMGHRSLRRRRGSDIESESVWLWVCWCRHLAMALCNGIVGYSYGIEHSHDNNTGCVFAPMGYSSAFVTPSTAHTNESEIAR